MKHKSVGGRSVGLISLNSSGFVNDSMMRAIRGRIGGKYHLGIFLMNYDQIPTVRTVSALQDAVSEDLRLLRPQNGPIFVAPGSQMMYRPGYNSLIANYSGIDGYQDYTQTKPEPKTDSLLTRLSKRIQVGWTRFLDL